MLLYICSDFEWNVLLDIQHTDSMVCGGSEFPHVGISYFSGHVLLDAKQLYAFLRLKLNFKFSDLYADFNNLLVFREKY